MYSCELLSVGTELLLGDILNTNAQYLSREIASLGISILRQSTVGDNPERLEKAFLDALGRSDIVLTTGGLGPTADDITRDVACKVMGFELRLDEDTANGIRAYFEGKNVVMPETNLRQAMVPVGGTVFENSCGTAPGMALERDGKCVILLPGPPREMKAMFEKSFVPFLKKYSSGTIISHSVRTFGIGESAMAETVSDLLDMKNPTVAPYAKDGEALLRVTASAEDEQTAEEMCAEVIEVIRSRLGSLVYAVDEDSLQQRVVELLREKKMKIALAESCTAGYIAKRITEIPGSSEVFECGIVSYSNDIKMKLLGVKRETIEKYTEVSEQTALEMARGALKVSSADIALSITGVAGPGAQGEHPAGLSYIGLCAGDFSKVLRVNSNRDEREYNRYTAASAALNMVREYLEALD